MSPKTVRFHEDNEVFSAPPTPSPTFSLTTLSTQPGPVTPPSTNPALLPENSYKSLSEEVPTYDITGLHSFLTWNIDPAVPPRLFFDLSYHPSLSPNCIDSVLRPPILSAPATASAETSMALVCELLPWAIHINAPGPFITISDLLLQLYEALRRTATVDEISRESPSTQQLVTAAFTRRVERETNPDARVIEFNKGIKRVDFLLGKHQFLGMFLTERAGTWRFGVGE